jgi:hypothetical protein
MKRILFLGILFSAILSFIEASQFLDTHHDILMFLNSLFLYEGLTPYKDFYVQYGIIQPLITSTLFYITGVNLFTQNIVIIISYSIFILFNYKIVNILTNNKNIGALYGLLLITLEPFIILPWPNFMLGAFSAIGLYYIFSYVLKNNINDLFVGNLFICLLPLIRSNTGIVFSIYVLIWVVYICIRNPKKINFLKLIGSSIGIIIYFSLYLSDDFLRQSFTLPAKYLIPYYFNLPNDPLSLLRLHYQLFFQEKNLSSIVSSTQSLFFWRYVLLTGSILIVLENINNIRLLVVKKYKLINNNTIILNSLFICGISASSSVFPIFDSFRAINSWFPIFILIIVIIYKQLIKVRLASYLKYFLVLLILYFGYCNISSPNVSVIGLIKRFDFRSIQFQFADLRNFNEMSNFEDSINNSGFNKFSSKIFISALDINPFIKYSKASMDIKKYCNSKFFYSNSMDFMMYLLQDNSAKLLPHKMFMSQSSVDQNGNFLDINLWLYPDFYESFNKRANLCIFLSKPSHEFWLKNLSPFSREIDYGDHILLIR